MITIRCQPPNQYTKNELELFRQLIEEGGEVSTKGLEKRIANAEKLATAWSENDLIAIGAVKKPLLSYQQKVFEAAESHHQASEDIREIGWLFTSPAHRGKGIGNKIMTVLIDDLPNLRCIATTRTNNHSMNHVLPKFGFIKIGTDYQSKNGQYRLSLFLKS